MAKYLRSIACQFSDVESSQILSKTPPRFIFELFEEMLPRMEGNGIAKILIVFSINRADVKKSEKLIDVVTTGCWLDPTELEKSDHEQQKYYILTLIHKCLQRVAREFNLDESIFRATYESVRECGVVFAGNVGKWISSPNRKRKAIVSFEYDTEISAYFDIEDCDSGTIKRIQFATFPASISPFRKSIGKLKWIDENQLSLPQESTSNLWTCNIDTEEVDYFFAHAANGKPQGQYQLAVNYLNGRGVIRNIARAEHWAKLAADQGHSHAVKLLHAIATNGDNR